MRHQHWRDCAHGEINISFFLLLLQADGSSERQQWDCIHKVAVTESHICKWGAEGGAAVDKNEPARMNACMDATFVLPLFRALTSEQLRQYKMSTRPVCGDVHSRGRSLRP